MRQTLLCLLFLASSIRVGAAEMTFVVAAPGFPSNTEEAQPTMDRLAAAIAAGAGWKSKRIDATYHPTLEGGLERLRQDGSAAALVPLPLYLRYREALGLTPMLRVVEASGPAEVWSLVAARGAVSGPQALEGWTLYGNPGYAPEFVRDIALGEWGELPQSLKTETTFRLLSVLRRAAAGEPVVVLLDRAQADSLSALPFAAELEVVTRSEPMIGNLVCSVGDRLPEPRRAELTAALLGLHASADHADLLKTMRVVSFHELADGELASFEQAVDPR